MDQLIFASLSHTHYWYEVGMLKVPAEEDRGISIFPVQLTTSRIGNLTRLMHTLLIGYM